MPSLSFPSALFFLVISARFLLGFLVVSFGGLLGVLFGFFLGGGGSPPGFDKFNHFLADYLYQEPGSSP